jgi:hypothetical protein
MIYGNSSLNTAVVSRSLATFLWGSLTPTLSPKELGKGDKSNC